MILSDREIEAALENRLIKIDPRPDKQRWTSTAIDLCLDGVLLRWTIPQNLPHGDSLRIRPHGPGFNIKTLLDSSDYSSRIEISANGYTLEPGTFVLGYTMERIHLPNRSRLAARVEGKSSLARLGVGVHVTAPTIHAGFGFKENVPEDQLGAPIQLEIFNLGPLNVVLDKGMPICQLILEEVRETPLKGYRGRFSDQQGFNPDTTAGLPTPPRARGRRTRN